jgi:hypothetical protein
MGKPGPKARIAAYVRRMRAARSQLTSAADLLAALVQRLRSATTHSEKRIENP